LKPVRTVPVTVPADRPFRLGDVPRLLMRPPSPRFDLVGSSDRNFFFGNEVELFERLNRCARRTLWVRAARFRLQGWSTVCAEVFTDGSIPTETASLAFAWEIRHELFLAGGRGIAVHPPELVAA
jgi:hypothetical protein